jgi:hypothetical protein
MTEIALEPLGDIGGMVLDMPGGEIEIGAQEGRARRSA